MTGAELSVLAPLCPCAVAVQLRALRSFNLFETIQQPGFPASRWVGGLASDIEKHARTDVHTHYTQTCMRRAARLRARAQRPLMEARKATGWVRMRCYSGH
jgi:hypothetical protein